MQYDVIIYYQEEKLDNLPVAMSLKHKGTPLLSIHHIRQ